MNVAFLIENLDPARGGMETSATEFLAELTQLGLNVTVVTQQAAAGFAVAPVHQLGEHGRGRANRYRQYCERAQAFLAGGRWDVIHAVAPVINCDLYQPRGAVVGEALERTVAMRRHPATRWVRRLGALLNPKQQLMTRLERQLLTRPEPPLVAALSQYMRQQLTGRYVLPQDRVAVVFNAVTVPLPTEPERAGHRQRLRAELGLANDTPVAMFVGHNFRRKGLARVIEALAAPQARGWELLVVGKDSPGACQRLARSIGVADRVRFLGARRDVRQLYFAADAAVLPTYYDPCSRVVLEALSSGLPCVTTAFDGSADAIRDGGPGVVISSPDARAELVAALARLQDRSWRQQLSAQALAMRPRLSMRRHAEEIAALYERIAQNRSRAATS